MDGMNWEVYVLIDGHETVLATFRFWQHCERFAKSVKYAKARKIPG